MEVKQSVGMKVPVRLRAVVDGSPLSGVLFSEVTCYIQKQGGASTPVTLTALNWTEVDATNMPGEYDLTLEAADLNTVGFFKYYVVYSGVSLHYAGLLEVVANIESDTYSRLGAPLHSTIAGDIEYSRTDIRTAVTTAQSAIQGVDGKDLTQVFDNVSGVMPAVSAVQTSVNEVLGLVHKNSVLDQQTVDGNGNLLSARLRTYDTAAHANAGGATGLLKTYTVTATYNGSGHQTLFRLTEV